MNRVLARHILLTNRPAYVRAFCRYVARQRLMAEDRHALDAFGDPTGGHAVPAMFDPTLVRVKP